MEWHKRFKTKACILRLAASDKEAALTEVVRGLVGAGALERDLAGDALGALLAREETASTGVGMNVAIPHVRLDGLQEAVCSLALAPDGIEWAAVDGEPVQILFVVLRPGEATDRHDPEDHLEMMRWIARLARDADFRAFALQVKNRTELVGLLKEMRSTR
jgi:mannitol/fructose-specific phosphotransferase system IIA component (Ntr-type)